MAIHIKNLQRSKNPNSRKVRKDLISALSLLGLENAELSISFVGSKRIKSLNSEYRGIPKETDVLSFPMEDSAPLIVRHTALPVMLGDIVISVPRTIAQAAEYGAAFHEELLRLLIHGLLHLIGYDHEKSPSEKRKMRKKEKELIDALAFMD